MHHAEPSVSCQPKSRLSTSPPHAALPLLLSPLQVQGITLGYLFPQNHSMNFSSNGRKRFLILCLSTPSPSPINTKGFNYPGNLRSGVLLESCSKKCISEPPDSTQSFLTSRSHWHNYSLRHSWGWFVCPFSGKEQNAYLMGSGRPGGWEAPGTGYSLLVLGATNIRKPASPGCHLTLHLPPISVLPWGAALGN